MDEKTGVVRMKITLEIPDGTKCLNVCIVYNGAEYPTMYMASTMRTADELREGAEFRIPKDGVINDA